MIRKTPITEYGIGEDTAGNTWLVAKIGDEQVGVLVLAAPDTDGNRNVVQVWIHEDYRRRGVASHLWFLAKANKLSPRHDSNKTKDGARWAMAVGK